MPPCRVVLQLLLVIVLKGTMNEGFFGKLGYGSHRSESDSEDDFHIEFAPLAFVPARSCHLQLSGNHGTFSPPVLFYVNINVNLWCNWTVLAAPGKHIVIYITGFRTNESCHDNLDEIIFEGISSSVETSIVYACWNKHTHVFATEALAVNVVLLWRSFSNNGAKRYFEGRYYIFDDPVLGPNMKSGNFSLASKQNISTIDIQGSHPDKGLKDESNLYTVFPKSSSSRSVKSSIDHFPEVHYPQGPPTVVETYSPTLTVDLLPTATTNEDGMTLAQSLSTIDNKFKPWLPVLIQSMDLSVYNGHTVQPTAEDLTPSQVGKWESDGKTSPPEFISKIPSLISTNSTELLEVAHLPITSGILETQEFSKEQHAEVLAHSFITTPVELMYVSTIHVGELHSITEMSPYSSPTRLHETPQLNTTHTVVSQKTLYLEKSNVHENQHLSRADFEPLGDLHFITTFTTDPPEPSLIHMPHTDFPEPSLLSDLSHSSKIHTMKTSQLNMDQTSEHVSVPNFGIAQAFSKTPNVGVTSSFEFPETISLKLTKYIETTVSNVSPVHHIDFMEIKTLYPNDMAKLSEVPKSTVTNEMGLSEMQHLSKVHTTGQSVGLPTAESAHLQMLSIRIESHPKEPISEYPWQVASSHPTPPPDSLHMSPLQSTIFTEAHTSVLHGHVFPQVSEQPFLPSYESTLHPPFTATKTLNNVIPGKTEVAGPDDLESYTTSLVPTSSTVSPISSPEIRTSVLDFQMVHPTYWTTVEQPLDPLTSQSTVVTLNQQLMLESTVASHPIPEVPSELIFEITKKIDKMASLTEYISSKSLESYSLLTIGHDITRSLVEPTKELDWWTVQDNLEASDSTSRIPIHPISTPVSYFKTTDKMELDMDITTIELITTRNEKSTYSYQTNPDLDLQQNTAGQPRGGYLDEEDGSYFFGNQSDFTLDHKPGDSLFVITTEIENKDVVLKVFQEDLVKSVRDKITERMIYFPGGGDSLILKELRWINVNRVKLTFWLQLNHGGQLMMNFLKTQLKALENDPLGSSSATLIAFTVEDVNECHLGIHKCHINAVCDNRIGSYSCICMDGYEDRSVTASGTVCIYSKLAEVHSLSEHMEILITAIVAVAVTMMLIVLILCVVKHKRQVKVNFRMQDPSIKKYGAHLGGDRHGKLGQPVSSQTMHRSPRHGREHPTARDTSSTLELTRITVEQASC